MASLTVKRMSEGRYRGVRRRKYMIILHLVGVGCEGREKKERLELSVTGQGEDGLTLLLCHLRAVGLEGVHEASHVCL